ncbi:MAG: efflux RND transporter permease subunit, partial [Methylococcales bacterium]|nr:efflux RND transporter permease subunit [Methylococcales bacterium]
ITVIIALVSAMILSITFVPACIALFFKDATEEKEGVIMKVASHFYQPVLMMAVKFRWLVVSFAFVLMLISGYTATKLGSEFVPNLDEGDIAMHALRIPGTSLEQALRLQLSLEEKIQELPEVERVFAKIGTAEVATDAVPPSVADNFIILKPREQWPDPDKPKVQFVNELAALVEPIPASRYEFLQPIQMRFNELLAGVRAELAIKVFGDDFDRLIDLGNQIEKAIANVEGIADIAVEQTTGLPIMTIKPKREVLLQYGISIKEIQDQLSVALGGQVAGQFYEGDRRTDIVVRLPEILRTDVDGLAKLPIQRRHGDYVPLEELAELELVVGYNQIYRENSKRRVFVTANVRRRDLGSFVNDVKKAVNLSVEIPAGYWVEYGGTYQKLESASERLTLIVPFTLLLIVGILFFALGSIRDTVIIFSGVPLALTGGILFLFIRDIPFSISAAIGFIALSGIAILDGLVMLSFIRDLRKDGLGLDDAIIKGALTRLRPVLTTTLVASLGFIPMALN